MPGRDGLLKALGQSCLVAERLAEAYKEVPFHTPGSGRIAAAQVWTVRRGRCWRHGRPRLGGSGVFHFIHALFGKFLLCARWGRGPACVTQSLLQQSFFP